MKQITLTVPDKHFSFFMKLIQTLRFVKVVEPVVPAEQTLNSAQRETWQHVKEGFEELKRVEKGQQKARPVQELFTEIGL